MCAFTASTRGVGARQARGADERASHNLPVAGSSPARPTCGFKALPTGSWLVRGPTESAALQSARLGGGHIEQLPSGSWRAKVYAEKDPLTGRELRFRKTRRTEVEARIELGRLLELARAERQPDSDVTVAELLDAYVPVAGWDVSTEETNLGYICRTIRPPVIDPPPNKPSPGIPLGPVQQKMFYETVISTVPDMDGQPVSDSFYIDCATARIDIDSKCCWSTCTWDNIAYTTQVVDLQVNGVNTLSDVRSVARDPYIVTPEGTPTGPNGPFVYKVGRTTGRTRGIVRGIKATAMVNSDPSDPKSPKKPAPNVIEIAFDATSIGTGVNCHGNPFFAEPGDSGALLVDDVGRAIGLIFSVPDSSSHETSSGGLPHPPPYSTSSACTYPARREPRTGSCGATDGSGTSAAAAAAAEGDGMIGFGSAVVAPHESELNHLRGGADSVPLELGGIARRRCLRACATCCGPRGASRCARRSTITTTSSYRSSAPLGRRTSASSAWAGRAHERYLGRHPWLPSPAALRCRPGFAGSRTSDPTSLGRGPECSCGPPRRRWCRLTSECGGSTSAQRHRSGLPHAR
jgi:hypothetical protein